MRAIIGKYGGASINSAPTVTNALTGYQPNHNSLNEQ
jgi:hypothetical protein